MTSAMLCSLCSRTLSRQPRNKHKRFFRLPEIIKLQVFYSTQVSKLTNAEVRRKRNELFDQEYARQDGLITRIEKIQVIHKGPPEECTMIMNKGLSTPYNCAMHIHELLTKRSALALVNDEPWDMHRPLTSDSVVHFLHFKEEDTYFVNKAFWRSCSFILGHILETSFKDEHYVELCSFPPPDVRSGSFVCDAKLNIPNWKPTKMELSSLSRVGGSLWQKDLKFERLEVDASVALTMFEDNKMKTSQIPCIAEKSSTGNSVVLYRLGDHIDISSGPMISSTTHIGRFSVTAVNEIESPTYGQLQRVQGLAMPSDLMMHYWTYEFLMQRAAKLNSAGIPSLKESEPVGLSEGRREASV